MSGRLSAAALMAVGLLAIPLPAAASEVVVAGESCTIRLSPAEQEEVLALAGVFAANWSAEILRDLPSAADDLAVARVWHADKTSDALTDTPPHVREAVERVDTAGARVGYRAGEAVAPLRLLVERNDLQAARRTTHTVERQEAQKRLAAGADGRTPALLHDSRHGLSVAARESWLRAWERTPGAAAEGTAARAELNLCATGTTGAVDRPAAAPTPLRLPGVPMGRLHRDILLSLLEEVGSFPRSLG